MYVTSQTLFFSAQNFKQSADKAFLAIFKMYAKYKEYLVNIKLLH